MKAVLQRVSSAEVLVESRTVGSIGRGILVFLGIDREDDEAGLERLADRIVRVRIFPDEDDRMNRSVVDAGGDILVISQFTLCGELRKGTRPSFNRAAPPETAIPYYEAFLRSLRLRFPGRVATGVFGAKMEVRLVNDGPVTLLL